jgi:hypothetical protein
MSQSNKVGTHKTSIRTTDGMTHIRYHQTDVVSFNDEKIILNSGGLMTATTKLRMNQAANQFSLCFQVYQAKGNWFVTTRLPGREINTYPFQDGMVLIRKLFGVNITPSPQIVGQSYQPKTGVPCSCKPGVARDNCPSCEGTGMVIDFKALRPQHD